MNKTVYSKSIQNTNYISSFDNHDVFFGINVTQLSTYHFFAEKTTSPNNNDNQKFDVIQFNFPHWRGKQNHKHNRQLLNSFLQNASKMLSPNGQIRIALCEGQGGSSATSKEKWRDSWKACEYAALHGLLLVDVFPFKVTYNLSSHRGMDRSFKIGKHPKMYVFVKPYPSSVEEQEQEECLDLNSKYRDTSDHQTYDKTPQMKKVEKWNYTSIIEAPRHLQLCCRHEIHVALPIITSSSSEDDQHDTKNDSSNHNSGMTTFKSTEEVRDIIQNVMPKGIRVEVPFFHLFKEDTTLPEKMAVGIYLVIYCGEGRPMTRTEAEKEMRGKSEEELLKYYMARPGDGSHNRLNEKKWLVSKPFPYPLLEGFLKGHRLSPSS
mmetsp:Transcript_27066/g.39590  ORF Transcript_27066/g.39590 Transcript_27066/m.39590 type:complete len:377 (+) Transcript_27066:234-1364(+)